MNLYSITSENTRENFATKEHYQSEMDFSDWELRMAKLVGFEEEEVAVEDTKQAEDSPSLQPSPKTSVLPEVTEQRLRSNPFAKLALVGAGTFMVVLVAGLFLTQLMSGTGNKPKKNNLVAPQTRSLPTPASGVEQLQTEVETLKTKLALAEQAQAIKLAQQKLRSAPPVAVKPISPTPTLLRTPTPLRTVYITKVVPVERPRLRQSPIPTPTMISPALPPSPPPSPVAIVKPVTPVTVKPTPDPLEEWARLAKLGSYGQVAVARTSTATSFAPSVAQPEPVATNRVQPLLRNPRPRPTLAPETSTFSQAQRSLKSVAVGTSVKAVLATAVFGETTRSTNSSRKEDRKNLFVVRLKEPLKAVDGSVVLPAKTELLTEINSLSDQGLLQLNVVKAIIQNNGNLVERSLPENALLINAPEGKPLVASQFSNKGSVLGMDVGQFVLGGIGKAAELFNRTESQVTYSGGNTIVTNSNPRRNILAGVLEGGVRTVVPQISQRNQQAISQMMQRSNIWFLPAGKEVEVYVNQSLQL
jgi:hypothetical protein